MSLWLVIGLLLLMAEVITTTFFVLFFGLAALSVAVFLYFFSFSMATQIAIFSILSLIYFFVGKKLIKKMRGPIQIDQDDVIGAVGIACDKADPNHYAKVMIGDTIWSAHTKYPLIKGQKVKIVSVKNLIVEVEPL